MESRDETKTLLEKIWGACPQLAVRAAVVGRASLYRRRHCVSVFFHGNVISKTQYLACLFIRSCLRPLGLEGK